jgi:DNA polymerase-4
MPAFCRDCLADARDAATRCGSCASPRIVRHTELASLSIAHIDCDAFYATIEKRDDPSLADRPVLIGGGKRGVVAAACYVARTFGVRSAMPMFEALKRCPSAVVIRPDMAKYARVGREVRTMMFDLTPMVEPLSIDEAFLDLSGTERLHAMSPARTLARFAQRIELEIGITVSIGLSGNKFLAKIASDLEKPRGYAVLGQQEAAAFLAPRPVSAIFGVGQVTQARLARDGYRLIADLQRADRNELLRRYGEEGLRLHRLSHGIDARKVSADREAKSISAETTFETDVSDLRTLERRLWRLAEKVSSRMKASDLAGTTVTLKLKSADFRIRTRSRSFDHATRLAANIYATGRELLEREIDGTPYRLIGIGVSALTDAAATIDFIERRTAEAEAAIDRLRRRFGDNAVVRGLAFDEEEQA